MICNQIFNEPHDAGGMIARTWALWTRDRAALQRTKLPAAPAGLLRQATRLELTEILALGFACWAGSTADRVDGPAGSTRSPSWICPAAPSSGSSHCSRPPR